MEPVQRALSLYRRRHFTECAELCEQNTSASKQLQWLGMLALTQHAWIDELELEGLQSLAEELLDNQVPTLEIIALEKRIATAQTGRPGTSLEGATSADRRWPTDDARGPSTDRTETTAPVSHGHAAGSREGTVHGWRKNGTHTRTWCSICRDLILISLYTHMPIHKHDRQLV
ncbi:hypothetical protein MTO96_028526 [Rhipicephalus appendiculatus]